MQNWKHALWLAKFELNVSKMNVLFTMVFFLFVSTGLKSSYGTYLDKGFVLVDLLYLVMFTAGALWTKPKELQVQRIHNELLAQPTFIMQNQLPVPKDALIKSRFIIYFVYSFPWQLLLLLTSYLFAPELKTMMTPGQFIAFSIIWLSFGIYAGYIFPASDAGDQSTRLKTVVYSIAFFAGMIVLLTFFNLISPYGIVHWTIIFAQKWPMLSAIISILLAGLGFNYWLRYMKKTADKIDYL